MKNYVYGGALTLLFMGAMLVPNAQAETTPAGGATLEQIQTLMAKIEELQKQLATLRGEVKAVLRTGMSEGMTGDDIKKVQELLATDPTIYPEGKVTGYYGNLTKEAIKRLQMRHELEVTGVIDDATREVLESYLKERFGEQIPPGLLRAPGIAKKVEIRIKEGCDNSGKGKALFCEKLKIKYKGEDDEDEDEDSDEFEVEIESEDDGDTIAFKFEGTEYTLELDSLIYGDILRAVADELDTTVAKLDSDLKEEIKRELLKELDDDEDEEDDDSDDDSDDEDDSDDDDEDEDD